MELFWLFKVKCFFFKDSNVLNVLIILEIKSFKLNKNKLIVNEFLKL